MEKTDNSKKREEGRLSHLIRQGDDVGDDTEATQAEGSLLQLSRRATSEEHERNGDGVGAVEEGDGELEE